MACATFKKKCYILQKKKKQQPKQPKTYNNKDCKTVAGNKIKLILHTDTNCYILWISLLIIQHYIHQNQLTIKTIIS